MLLKRSLVVTSDSFSSGGVRPLRSHPTNNKKQAKVELSSERLGFNVSKDVFAHGLLVQFVRFFFFFYHLFFETHTKTRDRLSGRVRFFEDFVHYGFYFIFRNTGGAGEGGGVKCDTSSVLKKMRGAL